jgi:hypothetical protein
MLSLSLAVITWTASAVADSPQLKGAYGFTGTAIRIVTPHGFNSNLEAFPPVSLFSDAVQGIRTFNGDGTGTVTGSSVGVDFDGSAASGSSSTFSYSFTYTMNPDGSFTSHVAATPPATTPAITGTVTAGPRSTPTNQTFTITGFPELTGQISQNAMTLTLATLTPTVETVTYSGGTPSIVYRICDRSRVLINLPNGG